VQWLTAGAGIQHAEMFPLLDRSKNNPLELFQIWLNLPSRDKMVAPYFTMLWADTIPAFDVKDDAGKVTHITLRAGRLGDLAPPAPPPNSWAARSENEVAIWTLKMAPGARWTLPKASPGINRSLYFFRGNELRVADRTVGSRRQIELRSDADVLLENSGSEAELLLLQGRPIGEPVAKRGPFVMNTQAEIQQAFSDYRLTRFGGWPWDGEAPVHGRDPARFARRPDGSVERPT
jgi:redox-sensitive bicupin YhaK (pirin superfamily)